VSAKDEQIFVAGYDCFSLSGDGGGENRIVVGVAADATRQRDCCYQFHLRFDFGPDLRCFVERDLGL